MLRFLLCSFLIIGCNSNSQFEFRSGDILFTGAEILTVDDSFSTQEDMVVRNGQLSYVGRKLNTKNSKGIRVIDLDGKTIMPGFIEAHTHPAASAGLYKWLDVSGFTHDSANEAIEALKSAANNLPKGQWIFAFGWDAMLLKGAYPPYKDVLDEISTEHPIWVMMQSMHSHYFNSYALDLAGLDNKTKNPPGGGYYEKDDNGELTGLITESAPLAPVLNILPKTSATQVVQMMEDQYSLYNQNGITSIGITGLIDNLLPTAETAIQNIAQSEQPKLRSFLYRVGGVDYSNREPLISNDFFKFMGYKYWSDGSPYTGSMLVNEPYEESDLAVNALSIQKGSIGHAMLPKLVMKNFVARDAQAGEQVAIHAQGDSACSYTLDVYRHALQNDPREDHRFRMEHLALVTESQVKKMSEMDITASFHINHIYYYGDFLARIVGADRMNQFMPLSYAANQGMKFSLHNDSPMYPPKMFRAIQTAVERKTMNGRPIGKEFSISIEEAIRAVTIYPAWQMFAEDEIGSLEVGKKADFVIVEKNPLEIDMAEIHSIKVLETFVNGKRVYQK